LTAAIACDSLLTAIGAAFDVAFILMRKANFGSAVRAIVLIHEKAFLKEARAL
jgi:hypothetical protein